ncbi:MAG: hypothetical protein QOD75_1292 [Blastocatellia bacterium]|jgi:hypothetical protein|nr:hypothetical protein [Blastocatellia bacterium]
MADKQFDSFNEFWPHYVTEHSRPATRAMHFAGTTAGLFCLITFVSMGRWWLFPLAVVPGYGAAWISHFFIEKNRPATFRHPLWSLWGDYKMISLMISGKMAAEVERVRRVAAGLNPQ